MLKLRATTTAGIVREEFNDFLGPNWRTGDGAGGPPKRGLVRGRRTSDGRVLREPARPEGWIDEPSLA
ncbi:hypothetical protein GWI33_020833 [Rhynchophorus ferrugineus]|uniref:Uncharacterized protein n=1 Tax=Rhynchophorus ferrugineus TaxID=354439 RepID=A0A834HVQ2_RHYFE|nr:hypothetical protein GWI33_020833 [Rhynchophorus ferrugineus]